MQSLLRWSIEHSTSLDSAPSDHPPVTSKNIDPEIIDLILGKPDAEQMKEDIMVATDESRSEGDRLAALDHLEMLVEQIDNANDLQKLRLWEPLQSLLTSENTSAEIKVQVLWVIGTAIQNNPAAQDVYLSLNPLPTLLGFLTPSPSSTLAARSKAVYALSGLLKHNAPAVKALEDPDVDGWDKLKECLQDPDISVRRKTVFLLNTLILPTSPQNTAASQRDPPLRIAALPTATSLSTGNNTSTAAAPMTATTSSQAEPTSEAGRASLHSPDDPNPNNNGEPVHANSHAAYLRDPTRSDTAKIALEAFLSHGIIRAAVSALTDPLPYGEDGENDQPDADFEEKSLHLLYTYAVLCHGRLNVELKKGLRGWIEKERRERGGDAYVLEHWNFSPSELNELLQIL